MAHMCIHEINQSTTQKVSGTYGRGMKVDKAAKSGIYAWS